MQYQHLSGSSLRVSRIGFGCWPIGGHGWGQVDDAASMAAVQAAIETGITFFDTADAYGFGRSEEILARALDRERHTVVIGTKFGVRWNEATGTTWRDTSLEWLDEALHASLRRLRLDRIPLYQIHWPDGVTPIESTLERLCRHRDAGKIGEIGCCNFEGTDVARAAGAATVVSMQVAYNPVDRKVEDIVLPACRERSLDIITHSSLAQGLCSGKYGPGSTFGPDDVRSRSAYFNGAYTTNMAVVARMREIGTRHGRTPAQVALGWILGEPQVASALVGIKTVEQVCENVNVLWDMTSDDRAYVAGRTDAPVADAVAVSGGR